MFNLKIGTRWPARISLVFVIAVVMVLPALASSDADKLVSMPSYGDVGHFEITSDGEYVVFSADLETDGKGEIYRVPLTGGTPSKLTNLSPGSFVSGFSVSPDDAYVVYGIDEADLYSVPVTGTVSDNVKLHEGGIKFMYVYISPDSQQVVYMVEDDDWNVTGLYSVPIGGGNKVKLNKDLVEHGSINYYYLVISPDSQYVVFGADQDTVAVQELYSVPIAGPASAGIKLNKDLPDGGRGVDTYWNYDISPDSSRVVYLADQEIEFVKEIFSVPVAGPASQGVKLNGTLPGDADVDSFRISPDSSRVVYRADQETEGVNEIYSVPIQGGTPIRLNHEMEVYKFGVIDQVHSFAISPDSSTVVYEGTWVNYTDIPSEISFEVNELFTVPISGTVGVEEKLWSPSHFSMDIPVGYPERFPLPGDLALSAANHPICDMEFNQASSILVFQPEYPSSNVCDLWSVPIDDSGSDERLTELDIFAGGEVHRYQISPDDNRVVYSQDPNGITELYSVPIEGLAIESQKLNGTLVEGGNVSDWDLSPDGCQVVYRADQDTDDVYELYIADHPCTPPTPSDTPTSEQTPGIPSPTPPTPQPGDDMKLFLPLTLRD